MISVLFVCTGNICRSAMAHQYMQKRVKDLNIENNYLIDSCGIYAFTGDISTSNAILAMKKYDVNLKEHRAKNIQDMDLKSYDYIITMTLSHKEFIDYTYPDFKNKVYTLKELVNNNNNGDINISDPWGYDINTYNLCASEIANYVDKLIEKFEKEMRL